jgi:hypothetical protein
MTLFIQTPRRVFEINDLYVMALSFLLTYYVTTIAKSVIKKQLQKRRNKTINIPNPTGGTLGFELSDDTHLAYVILTCISYNERYLVKDPELIKIVFGLVKAKVKDPSLALTPNLMRFLALKLIKNDQTLIIQIGNIIASSNHRARLLSRITVASMIGLFGALMAPIPYCVFMVLLFFDASENCGYKCSNYFDQLPKEGPVRVYEETNRLFIGANDNARQIEIYVPSKAINEVTTSKNGELKITKTYTKSRKQAKVVKFSDFKKTDPVLSSFKHLINKPEIPQKICTFEKDRVHDIIDSDMIN